MNPLQPVLLNSHPSIFHTPYSLFQRHDRDATCLLNFFFLTQHKGPGNNVWSGAFHIRSDSTVRVHRNLPHHIQFTRALRNALSKTKHGACTLIPMARTCPCLRNHPLYKSNPHPFPIWTVSKTPISSPALHPRRRVPHLKGRRQSACLCRLLRVLRKDLMH